MSFGIPTDIPSIPGLSDVATTPITGVSESAKSAITDLTSKARSELFTNPLQGPTNSVSNAITTVQTKLTLIASGNVTNNLISSGDATTFLSGTGLSDLQTSLSSFVAHTDRLSGVLQGSGVSVPGMEQIVTIGKMMNNMANLIDGSKGCLNVIGAATGLFSQDQINGMAGSLSSIVQRIDNEVVSISEITDVVINTKNQINAIVNKDTNFLGQCVEQLKASSFGFAISTAMSDPCTKFILERTGTPSFLSKLQLPPTPSIGAR